MEKIGVTEVRKILSEVFGGHDKLCASVANMPDDKLLKTNLRDEFGMDSLDFEDMFNEIYNLYGVVIDLCDPMAQSSFGKEPTVDNFIETVNHYLSIYT